MSRPAPVVVRGTDTLDGLELHVAPIGGSRLVDDYQIGHPALAPFFAGHPYDMEAYRRKATEVERRFSPADRARVADALRATTPRAAERLRQVLDGAGFFVTTGQQAGLFGGPLYTLHKVLSAVRLAAVLERELKRVVVPVFWVAADDHDFDEVDHILAIDRDETLRRIALTRAADAPQLAMYQQPLGQAVLGALDSFAATLPAGPFADDVIGRLRAHYRPDRSVAAAFEATMGELLARFDVVVISSAHPALKRAAAPVLAHELAAQAKHAALLQRTGAALEAAGYGVQVPIARDVSNVFHHDDAGRDRLVRQDGAWHHRRSRRRMATDAIDALLQEQPEAFSPNVLLRPVVESALLPTLAYVAGPGELAYFAQIGCLFRAHGIEPPLVFPRHSITLVVPTVRRLMDRRALDTAAFARPIDSLIAEAARAAMPDELAGALASLRAAVSNGFTTLGGAAAPIDVTLAVPLDGARRTALRNIEILEKKILARLCARDRVAEQQIRRIAAWLRPGGAAQERRLNIFTFMARFGPDLPGALAAALTVDLTTPASDWRGVRC